MFQETVTVPIYPQYSNVGSVPNTLGRRSQELFSPRQDVPPAPGESAHLPGSKQPPKQTPYTEKRKEQKISKNSVPVPDSGNSGVYILGNTRLFWAQMALAALVVISGPKKVSISGPTPSDGPRYGFPPIQNHTSRPI